MSDWDRSRSVEAFLDDLSRHRGIGPEYIPPYRALTMAFLYHREPRALDQLGKDDIESFVAARVALGESDKRTNAARTAATAFVQFAQAGGLIPLTPTRAQPSPAPESAPAQQSAVPVHATMADDLKRVLSTDALIFALAVTAPLLLGMLGGILGIVGIIFHYAALAAAYFVMLDHVAEGRAGLPQGLDEKLGRSLGRGFVISLVGVLPSILAAYYLQNWWLVLAGGILGAMLLPAAALTVYATQSVLGAVAPHLWVEIVWRIPRDYLRVAALYVALVVGLGIWNTTAAVWLGVVGLLLRGPLGCLFVFAMATGLGGVIHRNRDELGI